MQAMKEPEQVADIEAAYDWLKTHPQAVPDRIASIGFCMGGRMSFLAASTVPLRAAISFYGGGIAPGFASEGRQSVRAYVVLLGRSR